MNSRQKIQSKWHQIGPSIFSEVTQKCLALDGLNLAQGFPDFDGPPEVKIAAAEAMQRGANQYAPSHGVKELRDVLHRRMLSKWNIDFDPDSEITVFSGATEALWCAFQAFLNPGDTVTLFEPFYDAYPAAAFAMGVDVKTVKLKPPKAASGTWTFSYDAFVSACKNSKMLVLNSPHNPTGKIFSAEELKFITGYCAEKNILIVTDEVYDELFYSVSPPSIYKASPRKDNIISISSSSKTFSFTGWKIGYAFAHPDLTRALRAVHQFTVWCSATPLQYGIAAGLALDHSYYEQMRNEYRERMNLLREILNDAGFSCLLSEGTYFLIADYGKISNVDDLKFWPWLLEKTGVACIPLSPFYKSSEEISAQKLVRFGFCKHAATLEKARGRFALL